MPSFTPPTTLRNPPTISKKRTDVPFKYYKGTLKAPNVFVWSDGRVAENYNPPTDRATYQFLGGHEPVGVTDQVAGWLLAAGYTLTPDDIPFAEVSGGNILVTLPVGTYSRGVSASDSASVKWTVTNTVTQSGSVAWTNGASSVVISGAVFSTGITYTINLTPSNSICSGNTYQFVYQA